ncbi:lipase family protein [Nocardia brasiliensis]|uniref:lipase family protein n=1 Tax=Nocardia brasiliensis TaxID=37326 RepID=UPI0037B5FF72
MSDAAPLMPQRDPFYLTAPGYESVSPGTILRSRPVTVAALQLLPLHVQAWQLLYRTTDSNGAPYAAVTTVMIPDGPAKSRPLLSYQTATDATAAMCIPSYALQQGTPIDFTNPAGPIIAGPPAAEILLAAAGLAQGWAVSVPDLGGIDNRFATPREPGHVALDAIRAAEQFPPMGLDGAQTPVALWGYSGGGIATSWTAEMQPGYAPELNIVGAAIGAPISDLGAAVTAVSDELIEGVALIGLGAMVQEDPDVAAAVDRYLTPEGRALLAAAHDRCAAQSGLNTLLTDMGQHLAMPDITRYMTAPLSEALADPILAQAIEDRRLGKHVPTAPIYLNNGVYDEVSTITAVDAQVNSYCTGGASVTYRRDSFPNLLSAHGWVAVLGAADAFSWLEQRVAGTPPTTGCDIRTVPTTLLEPGALDTAFGSIIAPALLAILGQPIGAGR